MSVKRVISASVVDYNELKRLAISSAKSIEQLQYLGNTNLIPESQELLQNNSMATPSITVPQHTPVLSVMSIANTDFDAQYERGKEIGRGGFSTVFRCMHRSSGHTYAVKIIDLRPLRLREKFSPLRLRREVDIMRRLRHPNIIQFVDVFETSDQLLVVMEYAPGKELFDVILSKKNISEAEAKPIFSQIVRALAHLHSMNILHRDIKPENILILNDPDPISGLPVAKLLDFGLSKNEERSAAKTFVGTPCYLAPEVEYTSRGIGGEYSTPADCWSVGAVLYVMLVARFPEFDIDPITRRQKLRLPPALWSNVSQEAKSLILSLMDTDPSTRMTMREAIQHPWLGKFGYYGRELEFAALTEMHGPNAASYNNYNNSSNELRERQLQGQGQGYGINMNNLSNHGQQQRDRVGSDLSQMMDMEDMSEGRMRAIASSGGNGSSSNGSGGGGGPIGGGGGGGDSGDSWTQEQQQQMLNMNNMTAGRRGYNPVYDDDLTGEEGGAVVVRPGGSGQIVLQSAATSDALPFAPLLQLQRSVASCFDEAHSCFLELPEVSAQIRRGAMLCREQLHETVKMLRKFEKTAQSVKGLLPDLELALEEGEPALAAKFFTLVHGWVGELKELVTATQKATRASMVEIQHVVDACALNLSNQRQHNAATAYQLMETLDNSRELLKTFQNLTTASTSATGTTTNAINNEENKEERHLSQQQILELFLNLFGRQYNNLNTLLAADADNNNSLDSLSLSLSTKSEKVTRLDSDSSDGNGNGKLVKDISERNDSTGSNMTSESQQSSTAMSDIDTNTFTTNTNTNTSINANANNIPQTTSTTTTATTLPLPLPLPPLSGTPQSQSRAAALQSSSNQLMARNHAGARLAEALQELKKVDLILVQLRRFWTETSGVLDVLTREGQVAEDFIKFVHTPRLLNRFKERIAEYTVFWDNVTEMCGSYLLGIRENSHPMYGFLDAERSLGSLTDLTSLSP
eukprot:gene1989-3869_t